MLAQFFLIIPRNVTKRVKASCYNDSDLGSPRILVTLLRLLIKRFTIIIPALGFRMNSKFQREKILIVKSMKIAK